MNAHISKISSFILALLVLISTFSLTIEKHFCGDYLVDISYFGKAKDCCGETKADDCGETKSFKKKSCCSNELEYIQGQNELQTDLDEAPIIKKQFIVSFLISKYFLFDIPTPQLVVLNKYIPPKIPLNIRVLYEVFII